MDILATITGEGFSATIERTFSPEGVERVTFVADADIDADGANGQNGEVAAYRADDKGSELLANGGMRSISGRAVGATSWWKDIVLEGPDGNPISIHGVIPSMTAYKLPGKDRMDPARYVDAQTVPYIVVPPVCLLKTKGAVLGCHAIATDTRTGRKCVGIVADVGPRTKVGELSIAMAAAIGIPSSPRTGGVEKPVIRYEFFPGTPGMIKGVKLTLQRSNGSYV